MRYLALSAILLLFATVGAVACTAPPNANALVQQLVLRINLERTRVGLPSFRVSPELTQAAQQHACENASQNRLSHFGTDGSTFGTRVFRKGYDFNFVTENLALGYASPGRVLDAWLHSSPHRQNIFERRTNELGVGIAIGRDGRTHWVMNGGLR